MPRVKMLDTTHHRDYGKMAAGTVHEVSDEDAARFVRIRLANVTTAPATVPEPSMEAEAAADAVAQSQDEASLDDAQDGPPTPAPLTTPAIGRDDVSGLAAERVRGGPGRR